MQQEIIGRFVILVELVSNVIILLLSNNLLPVCVL